MPFAVAGAVATIGSAVMGSNASKNAAQDQENAANNATAAQLQMFNTTQQNEAGQIALGKQTSGLLAGLFGSNGKPNYAAFNNSPGYQFALQQGQAGIQKEAAASGGLYSSATLGALDKYNSGMASTQYNNYVQQLMQGAGLGNAAGSTVGAAGTATGQGIAGNMNLAGSAGAAGQLGSANSFQNALGSLGGQASNGNFNGVGNMLYNAFNSNSENFSLSGGGSTAGLISNDDLNALSVG